MTFIPTEEVTLFFNLLASCLHGVDSYEGSFAVIRALTTFDRIREQVYAKMNELWGCGLQDFLKSADAYLKSFPATRPQEYVACLYSACTFLDKKITYIPTHNNEHTFCLSSIIPVGNNCTFVSSLNSNYKETQIWINPKLPTRKFFTQHSTENGEEQEGDRSAANAGSLYGINDELNNFSYLPWSAEQPVIKNIILSNTAVLQKHDQFVRIGFSPLTDNAEALSIECKPVPDEFTPGLSYTGLFPRLKIDTTDRISEAWEIACENQIDILFMPEMLMPVKGTEKAYDYNKQIFTLRSHKKEYAAPLVTILPSCWTDRRNRLQIVDPDGFILAEKEKSIPYEDKNRGAIEAIRVQTPGEITILHIQDIDRVAVLICSEFLSSKGDVEFLCRKLLTTLLIVPSYSPGEQDFINLLARVRSYGTTVIWGNCCGAGRNENKAIGGLSPAGEPREYLMKDSCKCKHTCKGVQGCVFYYDLPLRSQLLKSTDPAISGGHLLKIG